MTGLWITLGIFLFFFVIFITPIHITVGLTDSLSVMIRVLFLKIPILSNEKDSKKNKKKKAQPSKKSEEKPKKEKPKKEKKKKPEKTEKKDGEENAEDSAKKKRKLPDLVGLVRVLLNTVGALFKKLGRNFKTRVYAYEICVASEDAAKTALMYGAVKSLSETLFLRLQETVNFKIVKKAPVGIYVDFLEEKFRANVKIDFSISIAGVFGILFAAIGEFIRSFIKILLKSNKNG